MALKSLFGRIGGEATTEEENRLPSHVCESCGKEYYADPPAVEIHECHTCGGVHVERV